MSEETFRFSSEIINAKRSHADKEMKSSRSVLAPLDRVQVNALLNQLPEGTQLTQEVHAILNSLENVVDLGIGGESADTEADTAVGALVAAAQGTQDVAGLQGGRSAGTTRGQGNVLEGHQERLTLDIGERDVHTAGVVMLGVTVRVVCSIASRLSVRRLERRSTCLVSY